MSSNHVEISIDDLESLMMAASCVSGVYSAIDGHKQDVAVGRTRHRVAEAISNANRQICNARHIKDPMENEDASPSELEVLSTFQTNWDQPSTILDPQSSMAVSILRKRLAVMGHMIATIYWGDKTVQTQADHQAKILWKLTDKGAKAVQRAPLIESTP